MVKEIDTLQLILDETRNNSAKLDGIANSVAKLETASNDHARRIVELEKNSHNQDKCQTKNDVAWFKRFLGWSVSIALIVISALVTFAITFWKDVQAAIALGKSIK